MPIKTLSHRVIKPYQRFSKKAFKKVFITLMKCLGVKLLNAEQTISFLRPYLIFTRPKSNIFLPAIKNAANNLQLVFTPREAVSHKARVWKYTRSGKNEIQLKYGGIIIQSKILCTDFEPSGFFQSLSSNKKRQPKSAKTLIAPLSQDVDGLVIRGYYDFVMLILAKLCRIKDSVSAEEFAEAVISYPLFKAPFELDYMNLLGIKPTQVVDSRYNKVEFEKVILCNSGDWYYPNAGDILSLKSHIENKLRIVKTESKRIYISRACHRRVVNEPEVIALLKKYDFTVIEDKPRSVAEQVEIYKNASFIIGPHGASFVNIIWCEPGTHLFEFFSPNYMPDYFYYLSNIMHMEYSAFYQYADDKIQLHEKRGLQDIYVSIPDLERSLAEIFDHKRNRDAFVA